MKKINYGSAVAFVGSAVNLALFLVKLYVAHSCNSLSIYLDSLNNAMDSLVCIAAGVGFICAEKQATKNYPFGFGRTEGVVNFLVSVIILITGLSFAYSSLGRLMYPLPISFSVKYAAAVLLTVPVKLLLLLFYKRAGKRTASPLLGSLGLDSILDFFITLCSFAALTLSNAVGFSVDGVAGVIISVILIVEGVKSVRDSLGILIGKSDEALCEEIASSVLKIDGIKRVENVAVHSYGKKQIANITVCVENGVVSNETVEKIRASLDAEKVSEVFINIGG